MNYANMVSGTFLARPNRFIAHVDIAGQTETVHVKNTGRCKELLVPGTRVWCQEASSPARKTRFDLIAVEKGGRLINMDSQAPNAAAKEWLLSGGFGKIEALRAETVHGDSRFDFSFFRDGKALVSGGQRRDAGGKRRLRLPRRPHPPGREASAGSDPRRR